MRSNTSWTTISEGIVRYNSSGKLFSYFRVDGKPQRKSLGTSDLATGKRLLAARRLDAEIKKPDEIKLADLLEKVEGTLTKLSDSSQTRDKAFHKRMLTEFGNVPIDSLKPSALEKFLNLRIENGGAKSSYNEDLRAARYIFQVAITDGYLDKSPLSHVKHLKRDKPLRDTPSEGDFNDILESIGAQTQHPERQHSVDFLEFLGKAGTGNSEAAAMEVKHVNFERNIMRLYRNKTDLGYEIPIFPAVRPLLDKLCKGKNPEDRVFAIKNARKALSNACIRLQLPHYYQRSLRRMFITKCIYLSVPIPVIAGWQGHRDNGIVLLKDYGQIILAMNSKLGELVT